MTTRSWVCRVVAAVSILAVPLLAQPALAAGSAIDPAAGSAAAADCRLINFDDATVLTGNTSGRLVLVVSGRAPTSATKVSLVPLHYVRVPEYWGIRVIGCRPGNDLPVLTPYRVRLDVTNTVGTVGIEVIGANQSEKIPLRSPV